MSIYGSTDLFVAEFRQLLGEKLLNNLLYSTDEELTNVELLKIRFGEECLQSCEVMLKDIQDSKRVNTAIQSASQNNGHPCLVDMAIISEHYWPSFPRDGLTYHSLVQEHIDRYVETYANLKKPRKLRVAPQIGTVELELDFADGTVLTLQVPPLQANLICNFSDASTPISLADLAARCDIDESDAALAMKYWVSRGVVKEEITTIDDGYGGEMENHLYTIVENQAGLSRTARDDGSMELDQVNRLETLQQARLESTKAIVADYVKGLLTSHGSMGVDRLCSLLHFILMANTSLSAADYEFAVNIASLRQFLNVLVDKGMLEVVDGLFSLARG